MGKTIVIDRRNKQAILDEPDALYRRRYPEGSRAVIKHALQKSRWLLGFRICCCTQCFEIKIVQAPWLELRGNARIRHVFVRYRFGFIVLQPNQPAVSGSQYNKTS